MILTTVVTNARVMSIVILLWSGLASAQQSYFGHYETTPTYAERVTTSQYITMRDGVDIAISISRPSNNGKPVEGRLPVIWHASLDIREAGVVDLTADSAGRRRFSDLDDLVAHGYVVATIARRGAGASMGTRRGYHDRTEAYDSYEVTEWLADQSWSTGDVGMVGCSNTGEAVLHALTALPPSLKAVVAGCFSWNKFDGFTRGGIIANWGTGPTRTLEQFMMSTPVQADDDKEVLRQAAEAHQNNTNLGDLLRSMPFRDSRSPLTHTRFWYEGSVSTYLAQLQESDVAVYLQGGWYDDFRLEQFIAQANMPNNPRLIVGPWEHCVLRQDEEFDMTAELRRFFDHHLKGLNTGIEHQDAIHYYTINAAEGEQWRSTDAWPLPQTDWQQYYLAGDALTQVQPEGARDTEFQTQSDLQCEEGAPPRLPCHIERAGVSYTGEVLKEDIEITGHPLVSAWITADGDEAHLHVYLEDVAPDGTVTVVTEGRLQASLRQLGTPRWDNLGLPWITGYTEDAQPLEPGEPVELVFDMLPISYVFKDGHRIQVTVRGADPRENERPEDPPLIRVLNSGEHRSHIRLPVIQ